jgi:hypothetical protein
MNDTTSNDKTFAKTQVGEPDSKTKVHISEGQVPNYVGGVREPITVRIDRGVYKEYKPLAKRIYGSTCKVVETHMISLIEVAKTGVYFCDTRANTTKEPQYSVSFQMYKNWSIVVA